MDTDILASNHILSVRIDDLDALHSAYMPFLTNGGIFLPVALKLSDDEQALATCKLNEELCLVVRLLDEPEPRCCIGRIAWITPTNQGGGQRAGLGLQFDRNDNQINSRIQARLAKHKADPLRSQTL